MTVNVLTLYQKPKQCVWCFFPIKQVTDACEYMLYLYMSM